MLKVRIGKNPPYTPAEKLFFFEKKRVSLLEYASKQGHVEETFMDPFSQAGNYLAEAIRNTWLSKPLEIRCEFLNSCSEPLGSLQFRSPGIRGGNNNPTCRLLFSSIRNDSLKSEDFKRVLKTLRQREIEVNKIVDDCSESSKVSGSEEYLCRLLGVSFSAKSARVFKRIFREGECFVARK